MSNRQKPGRRRPVSTGHMPKGGPAAALGSNAQLLERPAQSATPPAVASEPASTSVDRAVGRSGARSRAGRSLSVADLVLVGCVCWGSSFVALITAAEAIR